MTTPLLPEHIDVGEWIRKQVREGCSRIVLRQKVSDCEQHVREWRLEPGADVDALAEEVRSKMNDEARQLRGSTLFGLFSFAPNQGLHGVHNDKLTRRVDGGMGGHSDALIGETESADARGLVSQMMRHTEASARIALGQTLEIVEHYKSISKERGERVISLEEKQMQVIELFERLISLQHERDLATIRERRADKKHDFVREKLDMLTPVLMSKVLGAGDPKGSGSLMGEELLRQFLKSLKSEQMRAIWSALSPEQAATMFELYDRYGQRDLASEAAATAKRDESTSTADAPSSTNEQGERPSDATAEKEEKEK